MGLILFLVTAKVRTEIAVAVVAAAGVVGAAVISNVDKFKKQENKA